MKKSIRLLTLASALSFGLPNAYAGSGLTLGAISNLTEGHFLAAAINGGLGAASIAHGVRLVQSGRVGWGVFFLILEEQNVIGKEDVKALEGLDVASKEAFLEILASDESAEDKAQMLKNLFE